MKFNLQESKAKLADIMSTKAPVIPVTENELKQAILNNLPKSTICPKHNCAMELSEGISKKGESYRLFKCGIPGCDSKVWSDREAVDINTEVKDINTILGIEINKHPAEKYQEKIANNVEKATTRKEISIRRSAIVRDSAMFAKTEFEALIIPKENPDEMLKVLRQKWEDYFETIY